MMQSINQVGDTMRIKTIAEFVDNGNALQLSERAVCRLYPFGYARGLRD